MIVKLKSLDSTTLAKIIELQKAVAEAGFELPKVMQTIVDGVQSILNFEGTVIELVENDSLVYSAVSGPLAKNTLGLKVKITSSLSGLAVTTNQILKCDDTEDDSRVDREACEKISLKSMVVVPFITDSKIAGVLKVMSSKKKSFQKEHEIVISVLADTLAASLHNSEIAEQNTLKTLQQSDLNLSLHAQKEFLKAILENLSEGVVACDAEGNLTIFNKKLREWHGLSPTQIPAEDVSQYYSLFQADGQTKMQTDEIPLFRALKGETVSRKEMVIARSGLPPRKILASAQAIYDQNQLLIGAVAVMHDISEQMKAHAEISRLNQELEKKVLERTEQLTETMKVLKESSIDIKIKSDAIENSLNGFDIVNSRGEFIYANKAYLKMWGYSSQEEILGTSPATHCADPNTAQKIIATLKEKGECNLEFLAKRKDGSTFDVHMWARMAYDSHGEEIYPSTSIDITETKNYEKKLKEAISARDEFLSIASHELKTPLTSLKLQSQMKVRYLEKNEFEKFSPENIKKISESDVKQLDRLTRLVDDMLDITRINTGKLTIQKEKINLCTLVEEVISRMRKESEDKKIEISIHCSKPLIGIWDRFRIEQVITNLVTNAIKYGNRKPIEILINHLDDSAVLIVKDQGTGIQSEDQERIFERFERAISKSEISGLGLGLYIVKEIIERHGGSVRIESTPGQGSSFIVKLPLS
jgi:PAS domain S-box-containing protein